MYMLIPSSLTSIKSCGCPTEKVGQCTWHNQNDTQSIPSVTETCLQFN